MPTPTDQDQSDLPTPRPISIVRTRGDRVFRRLATGAGLATFVILALIGLFLLLEALPALKDQGWKFFTNFEWNPPPRGTTFGIGAVMYWTVVVATISLVIAVPVSIATALFITEYAPPWLGRPLTSLVDLLAAVPSLIYGMWGVLFLNPRMIGLSEWLSTHLGFIPIFEVHNDAFGNSAFVGGSILSLMVIPICTAVMREVFSQAPAGEKEGALALGGTRWGMIRAVVLPFGKGGIVGASMLGLGRALGETIVLALVLSPSFLISPRILERGANSVGALIANNFGEGGSGLGLNALMAAGLSLFLLTLVVNTLASVVVARSRSGQGVEI